MTTDAGTLSMPLPLPSGATSVGVALEVPAPHAGVLHAMRERAGDDAGLRVMGPHVTIVPPTVLPGIDLRGVEAALGAAASAVAPFILELKGAGTFRPVSDVVFARLERGAHQCEALHRAALRGPLAQVLRFPYHPHVTVAQDVPAPALERAEAELVGFRASFPVRSFALYELGPDECWHSVRTFPLTGAALS